jgi:NADH dehydrogenase
MSIFLIGFRNRFSVALNWGWSYVTFQRGARLITGYTASPPEAITAASAAVARAVRDAA